MRIVVFFAMLCVANAKAEAPGCGKVIPTPHRIGIFTAGSLAGYKLGDLYAGYTGIRGVVPQKITVDPGRQLDSLWRAKMGCFRPTAVVKQLHKELLTAYRAKRSNITPNEFISTAEGEVSFVRGKMDWVKFATLYGLSTEKLSLVRLLAHQISGKDLVAYGLTEIMPSDNGRLNVAVLEFLIRNYGSEFVYAIPARFDRFASFGFFQFTSRAVYDDGKRTEGASRASRALRSGGLSGSAMHVRGKLQFRAAYLFAIHNIASLVKQLNGGQSTRLRNLPVRNHDDLIQFIAAAHNGPAYAQRAARRWLDANMRYEFFVSVSNRAVRRYAVKTKANLNALRRSNLDSDLYGVR